MHWLKKIDHFHHLSLQSYILCLFILLYIPVYSQPTSVLQEGQWVKIPVKEAGVYKLDRQTLQAMGWDVKSINPRTIRIFGGNGTMLSQSNRSPIENDLSELAIQVLGESDEKFDTVDEVYFYAAGKTSILYDVAEKQLTHQTNIYSEFNYYYLTIGGAFGKRISTNAIPPNLSNQTVNAFDDYWFHEKDAVNLLRSGRAWWGEYLATTKGLTLQAPIGNILAHSELLVNTSAIAAAQVATSIRWHVNQQEIGNSTFGSVYPGTYNIKATESNRRFKVQAGANPPSVWDIGIEYDRNAQSNAQSYLNYISIQAKRVLQQYAQPQHYYFLPTDQKKVNYQINGTDSDWKFWNVTDIHNTLAYTFAQGAVADTSGSEFRKFIGFKASQAIVPTAWMKVANQSIKVANTPHLILISAPDFLDQAHQLATFKNQHEGLETVVVSTEEIYNEFSYGKADVSAIRNFIRYLYLQDPSKLKYVLLLGDATYDYQDLLKTQSAQQKRSGIPVYESHESLNPVQTYSSDDFYGFMEEHEGDWDESSAGNHTLELGVGRLPVKNVEEAQIVVDKIIQYTSSKSGLGKWRNRIHFVADDGDDEIHQDQVDELVHMVDPEMLSARILVDAYAHTSSEYGDVVPEVNKAILNAIQQGTLILNYTGHGGTSGWAQEQVLTMADMQAARGYTNMPLLLTATCDFGRYDDHAVVSGGELMVLSPKGAAIAALSTTRPVYSSSNFAVNKAFYESFLALGKSARIGDILRLTKNLSLVGNLNRNFSLLGDPSLRLARGQQAIGWEQVPDTLRAWEKVHFKGSILNAAHQIDTAFTGLANVQVYDRSVSVHTLGNKGEAKTYQEHQNKLFEGQVSVTNGKFSVSFKMPWIEAEKAVGKVVVYAVHADSLSDAAGQMEVWVGGEVGESNDDLAPVVTGYVNNPAFKNGDRIAGEAILFLNLMDTSGIYISNNLKQPGIVLTINDTLILNLNQYYLADKDTYTRGTVRYPMPLFHSGKYKINVKVGDLYNNTSEITFDFQLDSKKGIQFQHVKLYPNPFQEMLFFELMHNRPKEDIELIFTCFNKSGQKLFAFSKQYYNSELLIKEIIPPLYLKLLNFVENPYLYRLEIRSLQDHSIDVYAGKILKSP